MLQDISRGGGDCATKVVAVCFHFFDMRASVKIPVENGLSNLFDLGGYPINVCLTNPFLPEKIRVFIMKK